MQRCPRCKTICSPEDLVPEVVFDKSIPAYVSRDGRFIFGLTDDQAERLDPIPHKVWIRKEQRARVCDACCKEIRNRR